MSIFKKAVLCMVLGLGALNAFAQTKPRLAILPFTGGTGDDGESIAELFSFEPELSKVFTIVPRTGSIEAIMKEQQFQRSAGLTDADTIARLGKQANADYVVAGHIQVLGTRKLLLITIIHVESLRQAAGDFREYVKIEDTLDMIADMAKRIAEASRRDSSRLPGLAVLPFAVPAAGVNQADAEVLAQLLATELANSGVYAVLPRTSTIESVMQEHHIQRSGITDPESIKQIGRALNAQYVLAGTIRRIGEVNLFNAQILAIEDANLIKGDSVRYQAIDDGLKLMAELGGKLGGAGPVMAAGAGANFVHVAGGTFQMGSGSGESDERPVHTVTVKSFYISKYEVTQKEWVEIMGSNPSNWKGDNLPVENVSWYEAVEYCNRRSVKEGLTPAYQGSGNSISCNFSASGYRLPTEAEWEYAAKGGGKDPMAYEYSGSNSVDGVAWYSGNSGGRTHEVGTKGANSLGLYDMSGNVYEWCWDWYGSYSGGSQTDPTGVSSGTYRVLRGGGWYDTAQGVRSADRNYGTPPNRGSHLGFRLVRP